MSETRPRQRAARPGHGARVGALRRTASATRRDFTTLLDVLSRPGSIGRLAEVDAAPAVALAACGLVDVEVPLHVLAAEGDTGPDGWAEAVHAATSAPRSELEFARTVLALRPPTAAEVAAMPRGDALNPELGTRLFVAVTGLADADAADKAAGAAADSDTTADSADAFVRGAGGARSEETILRLTGPGIREQARLAVRGLSAPVFAAIAAANTAFPRGIDTFLVVPDGTVAGLPRTTRITIEGADAPEPAVRAGE